MPYYGGGTHGEWAAGGSLNGVRAAVSQGGRDGASAAVPAAVAELQLSRSVFKELVDDFSQAVVEDHQTAGWRQALAAYIARLSPEQLRSWRMKAREVRWTPSDPYLDIRGQTSSLEVVLWMLHRSCRRINELHVQSVRGGLECSDYEEEEFWEEVLPPAYLVPQALRDARRLEPAAMQEFSFCVDSLRRRNALLAPLVESAVRGGAACLPAALASRLDPPWQRPSWHGAGTRWAEAWAPERAAHAAFHPAFRAAVRALLLASHRGLPGAARGGAPISLPPDVLLNIVRCMALAPGMEAAWVPLAEVPAGVNLNNCII